MTVSEQSTITRYTSTGLTANFSTGFEVFRASEINVYIGDVLQSTTLWSYAAGKVVFVAIPPAGSVVSIQRALPLEREISYTNSTNQFLPSVLDADLDQIWRALQDIKTSLSGVLALPISDNSNPVTVLAELRAWLESAKNLAEGTALEQLAEIELSIDDLDTRLTQLAFDLPNSTEVIQGRIDVVEADRIAQDTVLLNLINALANGATKAYLTYAALDAAKATLPANSFARVTNDPTPANNWLWQWNGTILTKSDRDELAQALAEIALYLGMADTNAAAIPLLVSDTGRVLAWFENGKFEALAGDTLQNSLDLADFDSTTGCLPLSVDDTGKVLTWTDRGRFDAAGYGDNLLKLINQTSVTNRRLPLYTDGASLRKYRGNVSKAIAGTGQVRVGFTGDSWSEKLRTAPALRAALTAAYGTAGYGWAAVTGTGNYVGTLTQARSGTWTTTYNSTNAPYDPPTTGSSPDGYSLTSSTANSTISFSAIEGSNQATIFFGATTGTFRARPTGGTWTDYTIASGGAIVQSVTVSLGAATGVEFELLTGSIVIFGFHFRHSTAAGVEFNQIGHGGSTGFDYAQYTSTWTPLHAAYLQLDLLIVSLGTNDYWMPRGSIASHQQALRDLVTAYRTSNPNCGFLFVCPARSNGVAITSKNAYRDAMFAVAQEVGAEFYNMHDEWGSYPVENANGMWSDIYHISDPVGNGRFVRALMQRFLTA